LRQHHPRSRRPDIDHVQRCGACPALVGPAQGLAVDSHDSGEVDPVGLGKYQQEAPEGPLECPRVEFSENTTECIVAGNPVFQPKDPPQQRFFGFAKFRHVRGTLGAAKDCDQRDEQYLQQIVPRVRRSRVRHTAKNPPEFAHPTPLPRWESPSESMFSANAIAHANSNAIPLRLCRGILTHSTIQRGAN
jgi:hypothetical protein